MSAGRVVIGVIKRTAKHQHYLRLYAILIGCYPDTADHVLPAHLQISATHLLNSRRRLQFQDRGGACWRDCSSCRTLPHSQQECLCITFALLALRSFPRLADFIRASLSCTAGCPQSGQHRLALTHEVHPLAKYRTSVPRVHNRGTTCHSYSSNLLISFDAGHQAPQRLRLPTSSPAVRPFSKLGNRTTPATGGQTDTL